MTQAFQTFDVKGGPQWGRDHLPKLRAVLKEAGLDGFFIPHEDEYNNEYLPQNTERLSWATGFTGSAGAALVLIDRAVMFVDGRYTLQSRAQTDLTLFDQTDLSTEAQRAWIIEHVSAGQKIGYDPKLHSPDALAALQSAVDMAGAELVALKQNPIDAAWDNRPEAPMGDVVVQDLDKAGEAHSDKRARLGEALGKDKLDAAIVTDPASVAWLFNIRGGDVKCSPLPLSAAILNKDGTASLFINTAKLSDGVREHLGNQVEVREEHELANGLASLGGKSVSVDPAKSSAWVFDQLTLAGATIKRAMDVVALPKACKNPVEIEGSRQAHIRDGAAIATFLHWLDTQAQSGQEDEITAAMKLEEIRRANSADLRDISFETISGYGPNGAHPHYRVNSDSNLKLAQGSLYLVDSGGQYPDGTTDITRVVPIGAPSDEMRRHFTLVLKGMITMTVVRFPEGTTGTHLDVLARHALWQAGYDYAHGTGHGVGSYLGVHEGPQRIAKAPNSIALRPGMIVSNEPGYYKADHYGIRIENLQVVTAPADIPGGDIPMLGFESVTMAPIHRELIDPQYLTDAELNWLNAYHGEVFTKIADLVSDEVKTWLETACAPITRG
ncbi:aminopeptidase P family protein [Woodsholea maritima]|uniref:aminopeptidase P family protein n=1 Tax=Woodsholea maritima TaxID=240237 RepID=UPI00036D8460|nr:aminopeptidase P family protein [Woodsholea maritima]